MDGALRGNSIVAGKKGQRALLLGNEAIVRGALEAGVELATTYPGTPAAEIGDTFHEIVETAGVEFEYSVNEKVALEIAGAAALAGMRTLVSMKHVGLNVAADALVSLAYTGVRGSLVIVTADDPGCHSSQNEQDNRGYAHLAHLPMLEPSTPQEALDMSREAFRFSHRTELPVLLRTTTRVSHARGPVVLGSRPRPARRTAFKRDPARFVLVPDAARRDRVRLQDRMDDARTISESNPFNRVEVFGRDPRRGVVASGPAASYVREAMEGSDHVLLKIGFTHPLPRRIVTDFLERVAEVVVVEELDPHLEEGVRLVAQHEGLRTRIWGKHDGLFSPMGELGPDSVREGLARIGWTGPPWPSPKGMEAPLELPLRSPVMCPGCGHRATVFALKRAARRQAVVVGLDIGCYTLSVAPPLDAGDVLLCMGSSISTAIGLAKATGRTAVALIGDSTFYHAGVPALIDAVHHGHDVLVAILDNGTTAMTGHQPHPGVAGPYTRVVPLEDLVRGCGVRSVQVVDAYDLSAATKAFREALRGEGVRVVIARHPCRLLERTQVLRRGGRLPAFDLDLQACTRCRFCIDAFGCPALLISGDGRVRLDPEQCTGCGVCATLCPLKAVAEVGRPAG